MRELLLQIKAILLSTWLYRWQALAMAWLVALIGWGVVYSMPDQYEAKTKVYVDTDSILGPLLQGLAVDSSVKSRVDMMAKALLSQPNLEMVATETGLDRRVRTQDELALLTESLRKHTNVHADRNNHYTISFRSEKRDDALKVVETLLDTFVGDSIGRTRSDADLAQGFLEKQIRDYEQRLAEAEDRLADFKQEHVGLMPGEGGDYFSRLQALQEQLEGTRQDIRLQLNRRAEIKRQLSGEEPVFGISSAYGPQGMGTGAEDSRIAEMQANLDDLLLKYTEEHPDVIALKERIAQLEAQKQAKLQQEAASETSAYTGVPLETNPIYQQLKISLNDSEVKLAELRALEREQAAEAEKLKQNVNTIPEVEANLARLNRDYQINKAQYEALVERRERANISEQAEATSDDVKFSVIEPPFASPNPVAPDRPLLLSAVLVVALGVGGALAYVLSEAKPVFVSAPQINKVTGLPVFGTVSFFTSDAGMRRRRVALAGFVGAAGVLLVGYGLVVVFAEPGTRMLRSLMESM
jgi:polysaccharide chain length determinant protein (PEP-CTERM system associated)